MPLIIPKNIPAYEILKKNAFVMGDSRARHQDIRALDILIINLMPLKVTTENQLFSLLANSPLQVNITLLSTQSYKGKNTHEDHMKSFYLNFNDIKKRHFDGAIITGAPIEHLAFEEVAYWDELCEIMSYLKERATSSMYLCWGAMAGLYFFHGVRKVSFKRKLFGVFPHQMEREDLLLSGLSDIVLLPHSRHSGIDERDLGDLKVLLRGEESGATMIKDEKDIFILAHPEYDRMTLDLEYKRDVEKGLEIAPPKNYYDAQNRPCMRWRASASVIFSNWLNFSVYQDTPFVLD